MYREKCKDAVMYTVDRFTEGRQRGECVRTLHSIEDKESIGNIYFENDENKTKQKDVRGVLYGSDFKCQKREEE